MRKKFSAEDVLQDAAITAIRHPERMATLEVVPFVWFRSLAREALIHRMRAYSGTAKRATDREVPLDKVPLDPDTSRRISVALADGSQSPSSAFRRQESADQLQAALEQLSESDQETIRLLFFEGLSTSEAAQVLQVTDSSVSTRKLRALLHLRSVLRKNSDGM
jgi:RNA polymerase sigma factor (sigma-70 family)